MSYNELRQRGTTDFPIELYYIDHFHPRYEMAAHWHTDIEIIRIISGETEVRLNNNIYHAGAGDILFVNPETVHSAFPNECIYECVVFTSDYFVCEDGLCRDFILNIIDGEYKVREYFKHNDKDIISIINMLFDALRNKEEGYRFFVVGYLYQMMAVIQNRNLYSVISDNSIAESKTVPKLKKILKFIRENYHSQITLKDMAEHINMSQKYFGAFFKNMTTKTPVEYLNSYRIEQAARKLISTDKSVTDIAYECGFNDLSYFIKTFKNQKGYTPACERKHKHM